MKYSLSLEARLFHPLDSCIGAQSHASRSVLLVTEGARLHIRRSVALFSLAFYTLISIKLDTIVVSETRSPGRECLKEV